MWQKTRLAIEISLVKKFQIRNEVFRSSCVSVGCMTKASHAEMHYLGVIYKALLTKYANADCVFQPHVDLNADLGVFQDFKYFT